MIENMEVVVKPYGPEWKTVWDDAVDEVRQSSFLLKRDFMDYHSARFADRSLLLLNAKGKVTALLPACENPADNTQVVSHAGLTYGGLLLTPDATAAQVMQSMFLCADYYRNCGYATWVYKPMPHIYHRYPAEEDLYAVFRLNGQLSARTLSSAIRLDAPYKLSELRRRKANKFLRDQQPEPLRSDNVRHLPAFWQMLDEVLVTRHGRHPVHTLSELQLLCSRFPREIRLLMVFDTTSPTAEPPLLAGCLLFLCSRVAHVQYIAASDEGCRLSALDWLLAGLPEWLHREAPAAEYLDFGISTEQEGRWLNEGLVFQKEGFGARAVCYDTYIFNL